MKAVGGAIDNCNFSSHPSLFWEANEVARKLWGVSFTYDRFTSMDQVQSVRELCLEVVFLGKVYAGARRGRRAWTRCQKLGKER